VPICAQSSALAAGSATSHRERQDALLLSPGLLENVLDMLDGRHPSKDSSELRAHRLGPGGGHDPRAAQQR